MKNVSTLLSRRTFLRATGVGMALPWLETFARHAPAPRQRLVCIMTPLGLHAENLFPQETGRGYRATRYLAPLEPLRDRFTIFSGLMHPGVDGGHNAERSFLTAAPHPASAGFRNTISLDQVAAEVVGGDTRFGSLVLSTSGSASLSWTRGGVQVPGESSAARLFGRLFLAGSPAELERQRARLAEGRSVLDTVAAQAGRLERDATARDREKLDEFFTSVRETERKLAQAEAWTQRPKPVVDVQPPQDIRDPADLIGRTRLMYDLMHLAIATDSTRVLTLHLHGSSFAVVPIPGVTIGHHDLSHHGKDAEKLRQLALVEEAQMGALAGFLGKLHASREDGASLLDRTMVLFGSNLGNASSHDNRNLPVLLAGGRFQHGHHVAYDPQQPPPLSNLFVQLLQRLGVERDGFGSSRSSSLPDFGA